METLCSQLRKGGRLIIPVQRRSYGQEFEQWDKDKESEKCIQKKLFGVRYVPLTSEQNQRKSCS